MPQYKLIYFPARGRAEIARLIFAAAGVEYEDSRIKKEEWMALKPSTPFGSMPLLEVDGEVLCQSNTINRYLARTFGLAGKSLKEEAKVDMVVDCCEDAMKPLMATMGLASDEEKGAARKAYLDDKLPGYLDQFEAILKKNNDGAGYFVGDELTWCDIVFFHVIDLPGTSFGMEMNLDNHPKLKALCDRVKSHPKIAEWLENRP